ncbi:zinc finger, CCHC-type containing protein [Tanacetum coccineum]
MFRINIVNDNIASVMSTSKLNDLILWHARLGHVHFKRMQDMSTDGLIPDFDMDTKKCKTCMLTKITKKPFQNVKCETKVLELIHSDLCDLHATPSLENKKYFVIFIDDASRTELRVLWAVVRLHDLKLKTLGERGIECIFVGYNKHSKAFKFYVIEPNESVSINSIIESRDAIIDENKFSSVSRLSHRSLINKTKEFGGSVVPEKDDPKTFDEAMNTQDVAFWKEAINDEMYSIIGNNTSVLADLPLGCKLLGCKWIFKRKLRVFGTIEKFEARLVIQGFRQESRIYYFDTYALVALSTPMDTSEKMIPNNGQAISQLEYSKVIGCLMYAMNYTRLDIAFTLGKLSSSTMESKFVALEAAGKEAKWLRKLIIEIPLWSKPIALISIRCECVAILAKAYSQMYNGKFRHLDVRQHDS